MVQTSSVLFALSAPHVIFSTLPAWNWVAFVNVAPLEQFQAGKVENMTCGADKANSTDDVCTITVTADGGISGAWSAV
jgi:hypothetical protein